MLGFLGEDDLERHQAWHGARDRKKRRSMNRPWTPACGVEWEHTLAPSAVRRMAMR